MKIDFGQELRTINGDPVPEGDANSKPATLRFVSVNALLNPASEQIAGEEKVKRFDLAMQIHKSNGSIELTVENVSLVKKLVGEQYTPLIVGQAWRMLEGME